MIKLKVYPSAIARFVVLAGILFVYTASLYGEAMSCPPPNGVSVKEAFASKDNSVDSLREEFSFLIQDFKMDHQFEINTLNIKVRYCYEAGISEDKYFDFRLVVKDIQDLLNNYPNEEDYWEILNKKLTLMVLHNYPVLSSVTSEMQISPTHSDPYVRSSIVTRYQSKSVRTSNLKAHGESEKIGQL